MYYKILASSDTSSAALHVVYALHDVVQGNNKYITQ